MIKQAEKSPFFKGIQGFTREDEELLAKDAEESVYRWWWEFLRLSPVLWYARKTGLMPIDADMAKVVRFSGDLEDGSFYRWWNKTGKSLFAEARRPSKVTKLDLLNFQSHQFKDKAIYLEIPLTIRKETILKQVKGYLDLHHDGRGLDLAKTSEATFKLHTKRFRLRVLETSYWVLLYRLLYSDIPVWCIGDRLQIAPQHKVRLQDRMTYPKPFDILNSLTGRYLYKARYMLLNAEQNSFPNTAQYISDENSKPFGNEYHADFLASTVGNADKVSEWQNWLNEEYASALKFEIIRRNHLDDVVKLPDTKTRRRLPDFISGKSDLL